MEPLTLSLDTNVVIDLVRGRCLVRARLKESVLRGDKIVISVVVWHELTLGVLLFDDPARERALVEEAMAGVQRVDLDAPDAEAAAAVRAGLRRSGQEIGAYDGLIAGQALARGWTVVTANRREFERVRGLSVVDWTRPEEQ